MVSTNATDTDALLADSTAESVTKPDRAPIAPTPAEQSALARISQALKGDTSGPMKLMFGDGSEPETIPPSLLRVLQRGVETLSRDGAVIMGQVGKLLTIGQAADLLLVSRSFLVTVLDSGELQSVLVGEERRVPLDRLLKYQAVIAMRRRDSLQEMIRLGEEMGLYDLDEPTTKLTRLAESGDEAESERGG